MITLEFSKKDMERADFYTPVKLEYEGHPEDLGNLVNMFRSFAFALSFTEDMINEAIPDPYSDKCEGCEYRDRDWQKIFNLV